MSTITIARKGRRAAIAADTLTTWGSLKESARYVVNHEKILRVGDSYLAVSGSASLQLALADYFSRLRKPPPLRSVRDIFGTWLGLHAALKDRYFVNPEEEEHWSVESSQATAVIGNRRGIFMVGPDRTVQEYSRFYACGSGSEVALGAMFVAYDLDGASAEAIARLGVEAAAEFDDGTGLPVTSVVIELDQDLPEPSAGPAG